MKLELAKLLCECDDNCTLYENYSGRGMYGEKTTGVVCESVTTLLSAIITNAHFFVDDEGYPLFENENFRWDNMGTDYIVY